MTQTIASAVKWARANGEDILNVSYKALRLAIIVLTVLPLAILVILSPDYDDLIDYLWA